MTDFIIPNSRNAASGFYIFPITALIRLTPAEEDCSFWILNDPSSLVLATCGPQQISLETSPME
jgi:hypothetical protein